ncbi:D-TA family PLP-dependent enzyme [Parapedobacter sp. DT-150]|uniref:D-TA family PLP-dependent enzyme n=1 Tax=Parapedobacter sp. DT-150 TaxID=3396162 RepID=UPI003F1BE064
MKDPDVWYKVKNADEIDSPALLVYPERIQRNISSLKALVGDVSRFRSHVKTHKTKELVRFQLEAGICKFKCATIAEAKLLGECMAPDVLFAYPLLGPKTGRFMALVKAYPKTSFSAIVDDPAAAKALSAMAIAAGTVVDVYVDLDIGMGRTGIYPGDEAIALYQECAALEGVDIQGFHAYDGHVREPDVQKRKTICAGNVETIAALVEQLRLSGYPKPRIIMGGSPTLAIYAQYPEVECSSGTFILWDKGYADLLPEQPFVAAAVVLARVVSLPGDQRICVDMGHKAVASEGELARRVYFLNAPELKPVGHSEEHLVLEAPIGHGWKVGDVLYGLPNHICPTVALYDRLQVVEGQRATGSWAVVARNR